MWVMTVLMNFLKKKSRHLSSEVISLRSGSSPENGGAASASDVLTPLLMPATLRRNPPSQKMDAVFGG